MTVIDTFRANAQADQARIAAATALPQGVSIDSLRATYHKPSRPNWNYAELKQGQQYIAIPTQITPTKKTWNGNAKNPACDRYDLHVDLYDVSTGAYVCTHDNTMIYNCDSQFPLGYVTSRILQALSASDIDSIEFDEVAALVTVERGQYVNLTQWVRKYTPTIHPSGITHELTRDDIMAFFQSLSDEDLRAAYEKVKPAPEKAIDPTAPAPEKKTEEEPQVYPMHVSIRPDGPAEEPKKEPAQTSGPRQNEPTASYTIPDCPNEDPPEGYVWVWDSQARRWIAEDLPF